MRPSALAASVLVIATTALAACGDGVDKNAYVDSVTTVQRDTSEAATKLAASMQDAKTPEAVADKLRTLSDEITANATNLDKIEAPEDVTTQHQEYVDLMKTFGKDLGALAGQVEDATPQNVNKVLAKASQLTSALSTDETKIVNEINAALQ